MNKTGYILISREELISIIQFGSFIFSSTCRAIPDLTVKKDDISNDLTKKLSKLNLNSSEDFVVVSFSHNFGLTLPPDIKLLINDVESVYCFDGNSLSYFKRILPQVGFGLLGNIVDINEVCKDINYKKILKIFSDELKIKLNDEEKKLLDELKNKTEILFGFKREAPIPLEDDFSFINDVIVIGFLGHEDSETASNARKKYIARDDVALYFLSKLGKDIEKLKSKNDFSSFISLVFEVVNPGSEDKITDSYKSFLKLNKFDDREGFNFIVFSVLYLKIRNIHKNQDDELFSSLVGLYKELSSNEHISVELRLAYQLLFSKLQYSHVYSSYYKYKNIKMYNESDSLESTESTEINDKPINSMSHNSMSQVTISLGEEKISSDDAYKVFFEGMLKEQQSKVPLKILKEMCRNLGIEGNIKKKKDAIDAIDDLRRKKGGVSI